MNHLVERTDWNDILAFANIDKSKAVGILRRLPEMEKYDLNSEESEIIYKLSGSDLLNVSQLRTLVMLMAKKIISKS
jgi:hypothetical protein|tara:strand:- start:476 stop:706 length:231 start_codon:yes stop_codon:yes gene_type:complete